jgi:hypothetical protein
MINRPERPVRGPFARNKQRKIKIIMRNRDIIITLVAGALTLATSNLKAQTTAGGSFPSSDQSQPGQPGQPGQSGQYNQHNRAPTGTTTYNTTGAAEQKASEIIGMVVHSDTGERLGKVHDLIVSLDSGFAPYALVGYGGALGVGETKVAVPLTDLKRGGEKQLTLSATKAQFEAASSTPTGAWTSVADEDWAKNVDRFYGQPSPMTASRFERQESSGIGSGREPVRNPSDRKGAGDLQTQSDTGVLSAHPTDEEITMQVNNLIRQSAGTQASDITASVSSGVVTLSGKIANEAQKKQLDKQIKAIRGVHRVQDSGLTTTSGTQ